MKSDLVDLTSKAQLSTDRDERLAVKFQGLNLVVGVQCEHILMIWMDMEVWVQRAILAHVVKVCFVHVHVGSLVDSDRNLIVKICTN